MKQATLSIIKTFTPLLLILTLGVLAMAGCQTAASEDTAQPVAANTQPVAVETAVSDEPTPIEPTAVMTETASVDNCLDCHSSKDLLIQTADPEEEVINENEGEG